MLQATRHEPQRLVSKERALVAREVFADPKIFELEMKHIFQKVWAFLAHSSEIANPGDYVTRRLAGAPVIVVRNQNGTVSVLLNSCRHRGAKLCRSDSGKVRTFNCPYHGWSYDREGNLLTTTLDKLYPEDFDRNEWGLTRVPKVGEYNGLIFGCWNPDAPELTDYLGDFTWYLDLFTARTRLGMEVLAPPHRWRVKSNWKIGSLNFIGDGQHIPTTHVGPTTLNPVRSAQERLVQPSPRSVQIFTKEGHGCTLNYLPDGLQSKYYDLYPPDLERLYREKLGAKADIMEKLRTTVGTIFPNLSFIDMHVAPGVKSMIVRQWQPTAVDEMEILSWVLCDREASADYKKRSLNGGFQNFGAAGVFEQDDVEIWESLAEANKAEIARQDDYSFHTALPHILAPMTSPIGPGRAYKPAAADVIQLEFLLHWEALISGEHIGD